MRQILFAVGIALTVSILLTPVLVRLFTRQGFGHEIREDGPPYSGWRPHSASSASSMTSSRSAGRATLA